MVKLGTLKAKTFHKNNPHTEASNEKLELAILEC